MNPLVAFGLRVTNAVWLVIQWSIPLSVILHMQSDSRSESGDKRRAVAS